MELNCRVRNSQESIKDILKRKVLNLRRYDPEASAWSCSWNPAIEDYPIAGMKQCNVGGYLSFYDVINLFK